MYDACSFSELFPTGLVGLRPYSHMPWTKNLIAPGFLICTVA